MKSINDLSLNIPLCSHESKSLTISGLSCFHLVQPFKLFIGTVPSPSPITRSAGPSGNVPASYLYVTGVFTPEPWRHKTGTLGGEELNIGGTAAFICIAME